MFDIGSSELLVIAVVALLVIGPKDLPRVLHMIGKWVAKARSMTNQFKSGLEEMAREAELEEMEKKWAEHNRRIMAQHPASDGVMTPFASPATTGDTDASPPPASHTPPSEPAPPQVGHPSPVPTASAPAAPATAPLPPLPEP